MSVLPDFGMPVVGSFFPEDFERKALDQAKKRLQELAKGWKLKGLDVHLHMCHGTIYEEILKAAKSVGADLIVITSHRPELKDYLLGAERRARGAPRRLLGLRGQGVTGARHRGAGYTAVAGFGGGRRLRRSPAV